jgi:hypothetical protein
MPPLFSHYDQRVVAFAATFEDVLGCSAVDSRAAADAYVRALSWSKNQWSGLRPPTPAYELPHNYAIAVALDHVTGGRLLNDEIKTRVQAAYALLFT